MRRRTVPVSKPQIETPPNGESVSGSGISLDVSIQKDARCDEDNSTKVYN
jgi:hypothetical protein